MWPGVIILLLLVALLFFLRLQPRMELTDTPMPQARLPEPNPFAPFEGGIALGNDPIVQGGQQLSRTEGWAGGPRVIRRPQGQGRETTINMPLIKWAQARYEAYRGGTGDVASYRQALQILRYTQQGGWFIVPGSNAGPERFERYQPPFGQVLPATPVPGDLLFERGPATAAGILMSEI